MFILEHDEGVRLTKKTKNKKQNKKKGSCYPFSFPFQKPHLTKQVGFYVQKHIRLKGEFCDIYFDKLAPCDLVVQGLDEWWKTLLIKIAFHLTYGKEGWGAGGGGWERHYL